MTSHVLNYCVSIFHASVFHGLNYCVSMFHYSVFHYSVFRASVFRYSVFREPERIIKVTHTTDLPRAKTFEEVVILVKFHQSRSNAGFSQIWPRAGFGLNPNSHNPQTRNTFVQPATTCSPNRRQRELQTPRNEKMPHLKKKSPKWEFCNMRTFKQNAQSTKMGHLKKITGLTKSPLFCWYNYIQPATRLFSTRPKPDSLNPTNPRPKPLNPNPTRPAKCQPEPTNFSFRLFLLFPAFHRKKSCQVSLLTLQCGLIYAKLKFYKL